MKDSLMRNTVSRIVSALVAFKSLVFSSSLAAQAELPAALFTDSAPASSSKIPDIPNIPKVVYPGFKVDPKKKHHLTASTDPLYAELRDLNFAAVGKKLNQVARKLEAIQKVPLRVIQ
jgi:hypothetical protein